MISGGTAPLFCSRQSTDGKTQPMATGAILGAQLLPFSWSTPTATWHNGALGGHLCHNSHIWIVAWATSFLALLCTVVKGASLLVEHQPWWGARASCIWTRNGYTKELGPDFIRFLGWGLWPHMRQLASCRHSRRQASAFRVQCSNFIHNLQISPQIGYHKFLCSNFRATFCPVQISEPKFLSPNFRNKIPEPKFPKTEIHFCDPAAPKLAFSNLTTPQGV